MALTDLIPRRWSSSLFPTEDWPPVYSLQREVNRLFDDFWNNGGAGLARTIQREGASSFFPDLDIDESNKYVDVTAEVPGLTDKDIKLNLSGDGDRLTIEGEKKSERETKSEGLCCAERRYGRFRRVIALPSRVDGDQVQATCKNGVLNIHMKKLSEKEQDIKQIPIRSA